MDTNQPGSGAANGQSGAQQADGDKHENPNGGHQPDPDKKRALDDLHKFKAKNRELESTVGDLKKKLEDIEAERLKATNDWKTAFENERQKRTEDEHRHKNFREATLIEKKRDAVRTAAIKQGLVNEADIDFIPLDDVSVDVTATGKFIVEGADAVIEAQKRIRPHWFKTEKPIGVNNGGGRKPDGNSDLVTVEKLMELEKKPGGRNTEEYKNAFAKWRVQTLNQKQK